MNIFFISSAVVYLLLYLIYSARTGHFRKTIFRTALIGIVLLIALHFLGEYLGFTIPLNSYTISFSAVTGLPGVVLISLLNFIFI